MFILEVKRLEGQLVIGREDLESHGQINPKHKYAWHICIHWGGFRGQCRHINIYICATPKNVYLFI